MTSCKSLPRSERTGDEVKKMLSSRSMDLQLFHRVQVQKTPPRAGSFANVSNDPMDSVDWFHPQLTRHAAECMLIDNAPEGSFLLRPSSDGEGYVLSIKLSSSVLHCRVTIGPSGKYCFGNSSFENVRSFKRHFEMEKPVIGGDSGIRVLLRFPYSRYVEEGHQYAEVVHHAVTNMMSESSESETEAETTPNERQKSLKAMAVSSREGYLTKQGRIVKSWRVRWFILRNQYLSYYRTKQHKRPLGTLNLTRAISVDLDNSKEKDFCFRVITPSRTWYFLANSVEDCQQWVELLRMKLPQ